MEAATQLTDAEPVPTAKPKTMYRIELFFQIPDDDPSSPTIRAIQQQVAELVTDHVGHEIAGKNGALFCGRSYQRMLPPRG